MFTLIALAFVLSDKPRADEYPLPVKRAEIVGWSNRYREPILWLSDGTLYFPRTKRSLYCGYCSNAYESFDGKRVAVVLEEINEVFGDEITRIFRISDGKLLEKNNTQYTWWTSEGRVEIRLGKPAKDDVDPPASVYLAHRRIAKLRPDVCVIGAQDPEGFITIGHPLRKGRERDGRTALYRCWVENGRLKYRELPAELNRWSTRMRARYIQVAGCWAVYVWQEYDVGGGNVHFGTQATERFSAMTGVSTSPIYDICQIAKDRLLSFESGGKSVIEDYTQLKSFDAGAIGLQTRDAQYSPSLNMQATILERRGRLILRIEKDPRAFWRARRIVQTRSP